jgi:hypothetical protein
MHEYLKTRHADLLKRVVGTKIKGDIADELDQAIDAFKETFSPSVKLEQTAGEERNEGWDVMAARDETSDEASDEDAS